MKASLSRCSDGIRLRVGRDGRVVVVVVVVRGVVVGVANSGSLGEKET